MKKGIDKMQLSICAFLLTITLSSVVVQTASALDEVFYAGNEILFTDPDACKASAPEESSGSAKGGKHLETILKYFTATKGLTLVQAAGIAGNMQQESGLDPTIIQGGAKAPSNYTPVNGVGFGLIQWTFTSRQKPLQEYAKSTNRTIIDINMQLDYVWKEISSNSYSKTMDALKKATNPVDAAVAVHGPPYPGFEASADSADKVRTVRGGNAQRFYDEYKKTIPDGTGGASTDDTAAAGGGPCTEEPKADTTTGFIVYNQYDAKWSNNAYGSSTIGDSGCGPSAMAMIITALTGKSVTPADTAKYAGSKGMYIPGNGSSWQVAPVLAEHWGLKAKNIDNTVSAVNAILKAGGMVVTSGSGAAPFTSGGHYIMIRGLTDDGKWLIGDSNGSKGAANSKKEWDPRVILDTANAGNVVAITK